MNRMRRIDAHLHFNANTPAALKVLEDLDLKLLNICVAYDTGSKWREQANNWSKLTRAHPERFGWITSFDLPRFDDPHYVDAAIESIQRDLHEGAVGVKIWKNIGMEVKKPSGEWLYVDDLLFDPIIKAIERSGKSLLMHIAEPLACWQALVPGTPHYGYYKNHPEWYMYNKPEYPAHAQLVASRDQVVERYPKLRVIGAHLASLEYDVAEVAKRLERYPNFAVDTSARLGDLVMQDSAKVRKFFIDFQDRILYGTDYVSMESQDNLSPERTRHNYAEFTQFTDDWWSYLSSSGTVKTHNREVKGLSLSATVLEKIFRTNAQRWYPGL